MPHEDSGGKGPWKCAANVGYSPTFAGQENPEKIVEGHLLDYKGEEGRHHAAVMGCSGGLEGD